jgi:hypothetical protein
MAGRGRNGLHQRRLLIGRAGGLSWPTRPLVIPNPGGHLLQEGKAMHEWQEWCTEPGGRDMVPGENASAHDVFIELTGACPWCGLTEEN